MGVVAGGSTASSFLTLESTTGTGTTDYIRFLTGSQSERGRIHTGGNVSFGTTNGDIESLGSNYSPILTIYNSTAINPGTITLATQNTTNANAEMGRIHFLNGTNRVATILVGADSAANNDGKFSISVMDAGVNTERFLINSSGTMRFSAYGAGTATFDASGNITSTPSDERLKIIHGRYEPGLAEICKVRPIRYHWLPESKLDTVHEYAGFSAQNIRDTIGPLAIGQNADGMLSLQQHVILAAAINAIQELSSRNDALEARLAALESKKDK